ncbi:hypothetical protein GCM10027340_19980 [Marinomonas epiphytica]
MLTASVGAFAEEPESANFEFGLGYGLLEQKSLLNIDFKINMTLSEHTATQVYLNSNYYITGSDKDSFAQSEFASNWFLFNEYGRVGLGLGVTELEPKNERLVTERSVTGRVLLDLFIKDFSVMANYTSADRTLSNLASTKLGLGYYWTENHRLSVFKERFDDREGWRIESYFQPESFQQRASIGLIGRKGNRFSYFGIVGEYYFDHAYSLQDRDRAYH